MIHGCYGANAATKTNGSQLNIVDSDVAACGKGQNAIAWNQTGPPGQDGVSVTSTALAVGECSLVGGTSMHQAPAPVFLRCTGLDGPIEAAGALIATKVGTITASE